MQFCKIEKVTNCNLFGLVNKYSSCAATWTVNRRAADEKKPNKPRRTGIFRNQAKMYIPAQIYTEIRKFFCVSHRSNCKCRRHFRPYFADSAHPHRVHKGFVVMLYARDFSRAAPPSSRPALPPRGLRRRADERGAFRAPWALRRRRAPAPSATASGESAGSPVPEFPAR